MQSSSAKTITSTARDNKKKRKIKEEEHPEKTPVDCPGEKETTLGGRVLVEDGGLPGETGPVRGAGARARSRAECEGEGGGEEPLTASSCTKRKIGSASSLADTIETIAELGGGRNRFTNTNRQALESTDIFHGSH